MKKMILTLCAINLIICVDAYAQTQASPSVFDQGVEMMRQGDELIRQGQVLKENGQKLMQQSGSTAAPAAITAPSALPAPATAPAASVTSPTPLNPTELLKNAGQYQEYIKKGQKLIKDPKSLIPGMK